VPAANVLAPVLVGDNTKIVLVPPRPPTTTTTTKTTTHADASSSNSKGSTSRAAQQCLPGLETAHRSLVTLVAAALQHGGLFTELGLQCPKGVLLSGPPGTGKTLLAQTAATDCGAKLIVINGLVAAFKFISSCLTPPVASFPFADIHLTVVLCDATGGTLCDATGVTLSDATGVTLCDATGLTLCDATGVMLCDATGVTLCDPVVALLWHCCDVHQYTTTEGN
jgi:hypothetical protein